MRLFSTLPYILICTACVAASSTEAADTSYTSSFYIGGHLGGSNDTWHSWLDAASPNAQLPNRTITKVKNDNSVGYGGVIGYRFNENYAAEFNYFSMPDNQLDLAPSIPTQTSVTHHYFDVVGHIGIPIFNSLLYCQFGIGYGSQTHDGQQTQFSTSQAMPVLGIGDTYQFNQHIGVGLSYTHFMSLARKSGDNYLPSGNFLTLDLKLYFGNGNDSNSSNNDEKSREY